MTDFSRTLENQVKNIISGWIQRIRQDRHIKNVPELSDTALGDAMPSILGAMVTVLASPPANGDYDTIASASLEHGSYRAQQGFDPTMIAREYTLLRREIFAALEPAMLKAQVSEVIRVFRQVDAVIDQATSQSYRSYVNERLQELQQLQSQMQLTNQELMRLNQSTQNTFAYLSRELKTPLNLIVGYSELLLRQQQRTMQAEETVSGNVESLERVMQYGRQLLRLVNDSLELARTDSGQIQLRPLEIDVRTVINETVEVLRSLALSKGLALIIKSDQAPPKVTTDPFRLQQILTNLLQNAISYTEGGSVHITCLALPPGQWSLAVADTGIGIAPEDQQRIFEPHSSLFEEDMRQERRRGTGLSLAVTARLVRLLQGTLNLESEVGVGSTFTLTFPLTLDPESGSSEPDSPAVS